MTTDSLSASLGSQKRPNGAERAQMRQREAASVSVWPKEALLKRLKEVLQERLKEAL